MIEIYRADFNRENDKRCTTCFFDSSQQMDKIISYLSNPDLIKNSCCYVYGYGKQPKATYRQLKSLSGSDLVWYGIKGPAWVKFLSFAVAAYSGLLKVRDVNSIPELIKVLGRMSMVGVFFFDCKLESEFVSYIKSFEGWDVSPEDFICENDASGFSLLLDNDNSELKSGALGIVKYGNDCHEAFSQIFKYVDELDCLSLGGTSVN